MAKQIQDMPLKTGVSGNEDILIEECPFCVIDEIYEIDSYVEGNWYCYYIYADGDVYVVTTKNGHVDICVQLN